MHSCGDYPEVGHTIAECCKEKEHSYLEYCIADKGEECGDILPCCKAEQPADRTAQNSRDKCECDIAACGGNNEGCGAAVYACDSRIFQGGCGGTDSHCGSICAVSDAVSAV